VDREPRVLELVREGRMPFRETGTQELLERVVESGRLTLTQRIQDAADADHIVLTLGTPTHVHIEIDVSQIRGAIDDLLPLLRERQTIILRYTVFALPNLLMMECDQHGANVFEVIDLINHDYPRGGMAPPGLTGGTCLRKDFAFSEERSSGPGMLLAVSRVHESIPLFLVE